MCTVLPALPPCCWLQLDSPLAPRPACPPTPRLTGYLPDELVIVEEGSVLDYAQAFLHSVNKGLDFQVGHFVQREEADPTKNVKQIARLQMQGLQILQGKKGRGISW